MLDNPSLTANLLLGKNYGMNTATTREQLLKHAQALIRQRGYNGFSYRDLAELVGVKAASIHYYFPSKDDLLIESINEYAAEEARLMKDIDETLPASERLNRYAALFYGTPIDQVCLCGMLAADFASLSDRARDAVQSFYRTHERWLSKVVADGQRDGSIEWGGEAEAAGRYLFAAFQGALMSSRLFQTPSRLLDVVTSIRVEPASAD